MGSLVSAYCHNCDFRRRFTFGAGMRDFMTRSSVPAINKNTGQFVVKNYLKKDTFRTPIVFYNDPELFKGDIEDDGLIWGDVVLKPAHNFCPKCKQFTLEFMGYALID